MVSNLSLFQNSAQEEACRQEIALEKKKKPETLERILANE